MLLFWNLFWVDTVNILVRTMFVDPFWALLEPESMKTIWQLCMKFWLTLTSLSQNHRVTMVGRDMERSSTPNPYSAMGTQSRTHSTSGHPVPVLCYPHSREMFPNVQKAHCASQFVSIASCSWNQNSTPLLAPLLLGPFALRSICFRKPGIWIYS